MIINRFYRFKESFIDLKGVSFKKIIKENGNICKIIALNKALLGNNTLIDVKENEIELIK